MRLIQYKRIVQKENDIDLNERDDILSLLNRLIKFRSIVTLSIRKDIDNLSVDVTYRDCRIVKIIKNEEVDVFKNSESGSLLIRGVDIDSICQIEVVSNVDEFLNLDDKDQVLPIDI